MWWGAHDGMGWWMLFGGLWAILFWGGLVALLVWGARALVGRGGGPPQGEDPLAIARRRYARGEISREELEEIQATLGRGKGGHA